MAPTVTVGKPKLLADRGLHIPDRYQWPQWSGSRVKGNTAFLAGWDGEVRGTLGVADTVRAQRRRSGAAHLRDDGRRRCHAHRRQRNAPQRQSLSGIGIESVIAEVLPG